MQFIPEFMIHLDQFRKERELVRNIDDWKSFFRKWLDSRTWPVKSVDVLRIEGKRKIGPIQMGGRSWGFSNLNLDISPEARYEYVYTFSKVGTPIKFPKEKNDPKTADRGYRQECPHCEIWTSQIGDRVCPRCGRELVFGRSGD